jgi:ribosomal protein S18 acetylase RimI-like enzyme
MNYIKFFKEHSGNIEFLIKDDDDNTYITAYNGAQIYGNIVINWVTAGGYRYQFENDMSEEEYDNQFPDDRFAKIEQIEVNEKFRSMGYAKELMDKGISTIVDRGFDRVYLNASPMGFGGLDVNQLVLFYGKFGFSVIPSLDKWPDNKEMILKL